jgi:hypothetical protein
MPPGIHVLTMHDINDASDRRVGHALWWLSQRDYHTARDCVAALQQLCAQAGNDDPPICLHGERSGTLASSILTLRQPLARSQYLHAQGPPDRTPYVNCSHLFAELGRSPSGGSDT